MRLAAGIAVAACLALTGCAGRTPKPEGPRLQLSVEPAPPAKLPSGTIVTVTAQPVPATELAWVSGTVKLFGAPVLGLKMDAKSGAWRFRTMVPPMVLVPAGMYEVKAWGRTRAGEAIEGTFSYEVK